MKKNMHAWILGTVVLACAVPSVSLADYVLNGSGTGGYYSVYHLDGQGRPSQPAQIIAPSGSITNVYWPSAVTFGTTTHYYVTESTASGPQTLGLYTRNATGTIVRYGTVLSPQEDEVQIGMSHVLYDADDSSAPFKLWYSTRYLTPPGRATEVRYATSSDGVLWNRAGVALTATSSVAEGGLAADYVCRDQGVWRMFYSSANGSASRFTGDHATSSSPGGPFVRTGTLISPSGDTYTVLTNPIIGTRYLALASIAGIAEGDVMVLSGATGSQRVEIEKLLPASSAIITRDSVYITGLRLSLRHAQLNKVGISYFYRDESGAGRGVSTAWGSSATVFAEYTLGIVEQGGSFVPDGKPQLFRPFGPNNFNSLENPSPISSSPDCVLSE